MSFRTIQRFLNSTWMLLAAGTIVSLRVVGEDCCDPLPPVRDVLKRVVERAKKDPENDRLFDQAYEYLRVKTREVRTTKGKLKQSDETRRTHRPAGTVPTRIAEDQRTTGDDEKGRAEAEDEDRDRVRSKGDYGKRDFPITDEVLSRFDFRMTGREEIGGRHALVLEFKPADRDLPAHGFLDRFVNRMAGTLWVDETEGVIVKADLRLVETVSFVAGIAGAVYQLDCEFKRSRTEEGLWYTPEYHWRVDWRELFSRKVVNVRETKTELQRATRLGTAQRGGAARIELP